MDRGALDWAMAHGIKHGGFCPKGRLPRPRSRGKARNERPRWSLPTAGDTGKAGVQGDRVPERAHMKLYVETSVPNMLFAEDAPEKRAATEVFFDWLRVADDDLFTSQLTKSEIDRAPEPKRTRMIQAFAGLPIAVLEITDAAVGLSEVCVRGGVIPAVLERCPACGHRRLSRIGCCCKLEHEPFGQRPKGAADQRRESSIRSAGGPH